MRLSTLASAVVLAACVATAAQAQTVTATYAVTRTGIAARYGVFGYTPAGGAFTPLVGRQIVGASATFEYTPDVGEDIDALSIGMAVPVEGAASQFFEVSGADFTETATPGTYRYDLTTDDFNGTIRGGSFGLETFSVTDDGAVGTDGAYAAGSGFAYTVAVPEPAGLAAATAGASLLARRRRR